MVESATSCSDESDDTFKIVETTHRKLLDARYKDGYRDGVTDGQEVTLQNGFNKGYTSGYISVYNVARLRGILWSLAAVNNSELSEEITKKLKESEDRMKLAAASFDSSVPSDDESLKLLKSQVLQDLKECFLSECKKLNLIDEESTLQLFLSAIE